MKRKITLLLAVLLTSTAILAQEQNAAFTKEDYLQRSKKKKKTGWTLLGTGTAVLVTGAVLVDATWEEGANTTSDIAGFMVLGGLAMDLTSIPFFVSASRNKEKAIKLSLNVQPLLLPPSSKLASLSPGIGIRIPL